MKTLLAILTVTVVGTSAYFITNDRADRAAVALDEACKIQLFNRDVKNAIEMGCWGEPSPSREPPHRDANFDDFLKAARH
jgi:hypothetical protein